MSSLALLAVPQVLHRGLAVPVACGERGRGPEELLPFYDEMGPDGVRDYWRRKNAVSLDGRKTGVLPD